MINKFNEIISNILEEKKVFQSYRYEMTPELFGYLIEVNDDGAKVYIERLGGKEFYFVGINLDFLGQMSEQELTRWTWEFTKKAKIKKSYKRIHKDLYDLLQYIKRSVMYSRTADISTKL